MDGIIGALILTLIAGAATGIGGALVLFKKKLSSNFLAGALGLSAGVMIFISLAELYPEAQAEVAGITTGTHGKTLVLIAFFVGMGIITLIDFLIPEYENPHEAPGLSLADKTAAVDRLEHTENATALKKLGIMSALAIAIHNFPEGIATYIGAMTLRWVQESHSPSPSTIFRKELPLRYRYITQQKAREKLCCTQPCQALAKYLEPCCA